LSRASIKQFKSWETGYSESSGSTYADQKTEIQTTFVVATPTTRQRCNQTSARLTESCHLRSKCVLPKFGTQRADTQPNIDGRGGVNPNLAGTVSTGVKPDVRATGIVVGKSSQSLTTSIVTRFLSFPAELFEHVFMTCCHSYKHVGTKAKRPLPVAVKYAHKHFENIWIADGSTLEALFRKLESLQDAPQGKLAGKLCTVIDLLIASTSVVSHQYLHTIRISWPICSISPASTLLILDRGFYDWIFCCLIAKQVDFITQIQCSV